MRVRRPLCPLFISTGLGQFRGLRNEFQDVFTYILVVGGNERDQRPQLRVGRPWVLVVDSGLTPFNNLLRSSFQLR